MRNETKEINNVRIDGKEGTLYFTNYFTYLGVHVNFLLNKMVNVTNKISKASKEIEAIKSY